MLYAIESALTNTHWNKPDHVTREALLMAVDAAEGESWLLLMQLNEKKSYQANKKAGNPAFCLLCCD
jgi:hypothetical protein